MSEESQPGRPVGAAGRSTVSGEYTSHNILVDLDTEYEGDLLSDAPAAKHGFRRFISTIAAISSGLGPFGPGFRRCLGAKSKRYLRFTKARWNTMSVDGFSTLAERSSRPGRIRLAQRLAMMRSIGRRFGALARDRFIISS